jgi:hypothetical protein
MATERFSIEKVLNDTARLASAWAVIGESTTPPMGVRVAFHMPTITVGLDPTVPAGEIRTSTPNTPAEAQQ